MHDPQSRLFDMLTTVPHLTRVCVDQHVLKELRSVCSEARLLSGGLFTGLTVNLDKLMSRVFECGLSSMLSKCQLRRLCVVLNLEYYGEVSAFYTPCMWTVNIIVDLIHVLSCTQSTSFLH